VSAAEDDICLSMPARAEHVAVVRQVVGALASAVGLDETGVDDVKLAVTEACTNVVRHAYRDAEGRLEVTLAADDGRLVVTVADHGRGIARAAAHDDSTGLGLPLMRTLAAEFEVTDIPDDGTQVRMAFEAGTGTLEAA
jgi:serine/threonine-protein kinase RsbW